MTRRVGYSPQAQRHLTDLYDWIAHESGFPERAEAYVTALMDRCDARAQLTDLLLEGCHLRLRGGLALRLQHDRR